MRIRRFLFRRTTSTKTNLTPGRRRGRKDLPRSSSGAADQGDEVALKSHGANSIPVEPKPVVESKPLVFISPLPGRWVRCAIAMLAGAVALTSQIADAATEPTALESANNAFAQGDYVQATRGYEAVIARRGYSAPLLFNLANAHAKNGQPGLAILNYERALALSPNDPAVLANLDRARREAGLPIPAPRWDRRAANLLPLNGWSVLAGAGLLILCVLVPLGRLWPDHRLAVNGTKAAAGLVLTAALAALALRWPELDRAIVTSKNAAARVSPLGMADALFNLPEGQAIRVIKTKQTFSLIQTDEGREGWVNSRDIARVLVGPGAIESPRS